MTEDTKDQSPAPEGGGKKASSEPSAERIVTFGGGGGVLEEGEVGQPPSAKRKKALAAVCAAVAVVVLACAFALGSGAFQTTEDVAAVSTTSRNANAESLSEDRADGGEEESDGAKTAEGAQASEEATREESEKPTSEPQPSSGQPASPESARSDSANAGTPSGQTEGEPSSTPSVQPSAPAEPEAPVGVTVSFSIVSDAVGSPVSMATSLTLDEGATVFDALAAAGIDFVARDSAYGKYVAAIGGLAEKQHGGTSGWMYSVNGEVVMTSCSNCVLRQGDRVQWFYSVSG